MVSEDLKITLPIIILVTSYCRCYGRIDPTRILETNLFPRGQMLLIQNSRILFRASQI